MVVVGFGVFVVRFGIVGGGWLIDGDVDWVVWEGDVGERWISDDGLFWC